MNPIDNEFNNKIDHMDHLLDVQLTGIDTQQFNEILEAYFETYPKVATVGWLEPHFISWLNTESNLLITSWRLQKNLLEIGYQSITDFVLETYDLIVYDFKTELSLFNDGENSKCVNEEGHNIIFKKYNQNKINNQPNENK